MRTLGDVFRERREELGITAQEVARKANIDRTIYSKIENNQYKFSTLKTITKIAKALGIDDFSFIKQVK